MLENCCVCLNDLFHLNKLSDEDERNISLFKKLVSSVPEIAWINNYQICKPCTNLLDIVYSFRETCLKSDILRRQKENELCKENDGKKEFRDTSTENEESKTLVDKYEEITDTFMDENSSDSSDAYIEDSKVNTKGKKIKPSKKRKRTLRFQCDKCTEKHSSSKELINHCVDKHGMDFKDVRPFVCTKCNSRFASSSNLLQHIKYHEAVRSNVCSYCGKGFITKTDLKIHEKQHLNLREYECNVCMKSYNTHKDLRSHKLVVHTDPEVWKFLCEYCNKKFPIKSNYDSHMRRHTGEKNFECHLCHKKFLEKCVLQRHMKSHTNVREFRCTECQKEYKEKRIMQIHMAKIHGIGVGEIKLPSKERKYICHICPKAYYAKNKLTRHLYTHSGEKPFFCTICNKKFNDQSYVKQHMKKTHNFVKVENQI
ncbi:unnamed protein product [Phyllotreta striolata]|uniref:C2H2-type domain-containing protein n=1 Tax=Phyllotreta striolata TaxID=444603 RepID=A0A9N9XR44_PHYSR|nr:unnamed protein product [Phyllotreta striolata]